MGSHRVRHDLVCTHHQSPPSPVSPPHPLAWDLGLRSCFWEIPSQDTISDARRYKERLRLWHVLQARGHQAPFHADASLAFSSGHPASGALCHGHSPDSPRGQPLSRAPCMAPLAQEAAEFLPAAPNFLEMLSSGPVLREGVRRGSVGPAPNPPPFLYMAAPGSESGEPSIGQGSG